MEGSAARVRAVRDLVRPIAYPEDEGTDRCDGCDGACGHPSDCHMPKGATAADASAWTLTRVDDTRVGTVLRLSDGREVIEYIIPDRASYDDMKNGLRALSDRLHGRQPTWWTDHRNVALGAGLGGGGPKLDRVAVRLDAIHELLDANAIRCAGTLNRLDELRAAIDALAGSVTRSGDVTLNVRLNGSPAGEDGEALAAQVTGRKTKAHPCRETARIAVPMECLTEGGAVDWHAVEALAKLRVLEARLGDGARR